MNVYPSFLASLILAATATAFGPVHPTERRDVGLQPDGTIVLLPTEQVTLKFDVRDGKLINPKVVPTWPQQPDTITFWVKRTGGWRTVTGPTMPVRDSLSIETTLSGSVTVRCSYWLPNAQKPKSISAARNGRSFDGPIAKALLTDIRLNPK
jgi:hypothetical protein